MYWLYDGALPAAAHVWAAAAGGTGVSVPRYIADALVEGHDMLSAAIESTRRAHQETGDDWPPPQGCEIFVDHGVASLLWEAEGHRIHLGPTPGGVWNVTIECHSEGACDRIRIAEVTKKLWEECGDVLQKVPSEVLHELIRAAIRESGSP